MLFVYSIIIYIGFALYLNIYPDTQNMFAAILIVILGLAHLGLLVKFLFSVQEGIFIGVILVFASTKLKFG